MRELNPEAAMWETTMKTNAILADIYDLLNLLNANFVASRSGKATRKPKPYPRPGKKEDNNTRHFGKGALPPDKLREWFEKKRAEKCRELK